MAPASTATAHLPNSQERGRGLLLSGAGAGAGLQLVVPITTRPPMGQGVSPYAINGDPVRRSVSTPPMWTFSGWGPRGDCRRRSWSIRSCSRGRAVGVRVEDHGEVDHGRGWRGRARRRCGALAAILLRWASADSRLPVGHHLEDHPVGIRGPLRVTEAQPVMLFIGTPTSAFGTRRGPPARANSTTIVGMTQTHRGLWAASAADRCSSDSEGTTPPRIAIRAVDPIIDEDMISD